MKQIFFKGGAVPQQDPHAYVIEHIQRGDEMMQKMHEKVSRVIEETYKCVLCILKLIQQVDRLKKEILSLKENSNE